MQEVQQQEQQKKLQLEREEQYKPGNIFVYQEGTRKGILVPYAQLKDSVRVKEWSTESQKWIYHLRKEISLPYSIDVIEVVFGVSDLKNLTWDQLVKVIKCVDSLSIQPYPEDKLLLTQLFIDSAVYWINDIGDKIMNSQATPDYIVFDQIRNPFVVQTIINKVLSTPNNFCQKFTDRHNRKLGRGEGYANAAASVNEVFRDWLPRIGFTSAPELISVMLAAVQDVTSGWNIDDENGRKEQKRIREQEEEAKKWFWQRKKWF
jgi:hypothetical protein